MKFSCPGCHAIFTIADEKIPHPKGLRISCPKCNETIELNRDDGYQETDAQSSEQSASSSLYEDELQEAIPPLEVVEEGVRSALLYIQEHSTLAKLQEIMNQLDYQVIIAESEKAALTRLKHNFYDLVVFQDSQQGLDTQENYLLQQISLLPIHLRRRFFFCLISQTLPTSDFMAAFRLGANLIINTADLGKAKAVFSQVMKVHQSSYHIFIDELEKKGQL